MADSLLAAVHIAGGKRVCYGNETDGLRVPSSRRRE